MTADPGRAALVPQAGLRAGAPRPGGSSALLMSSRGVRSSRRWWSRRGTLSLTVLAALLAVTALLVIRGVGGQPLAPGGTSVMPTSAAIEAEWGVRFTQIGISADGGMVDVRYVVLDVDKAMSVAETAEKTPLLMEEDSKRMIFAVAMKAHAHDLHVGGRYYLLYRNTNGLLKPGRRVTIQLGGDRLEHVAVLGTTTG